MEDITRFDMCVGLLAETFTRYSGQDGDPDTLSKKEVKELFKNELKSTLGKVDDQAVLDEMFNTLDADGDGVVNFMEFITLVATVADMCRQHLQDLSQQAQCQLPAL